jgi:hypothetical protein
VLFRPSPDSDLDLAGHPLVQEVVIHLGARNVKDEGSGMEDSRTYNEKDRIEISAHLALLGSPLAVGVPVEYNLVRSSVPDLGRGVRESTISGPFKLVAGRLLDEERLGASRMSIVIDALFDIVVEDGTGRDLLF